MLHIMSNKPISDNTIMQQALNDLSAKLPPSWSTETRASSARGGPRRADAIMELEAPNGERTALVIEVKRQLEPKDVDYVVAELSDWEDATPFIIAPYLSERTRERLATAGSGYLDLTGNSRLSLDSPAVLIETTGANRDPWRTERSARSLKGAKAGRIVRGLCDFLPPIGVRDLAKRTGTDPGYVSRVLDLLDKEALIGRRPRGPVTEVDWRGLIRRWTEDYALLESNRPVAYLEPRGLSVFATKLRDPAGKRTVRYSVTGSLAAAQLAPVAAARLAVCFVDEPEQAAEWLELRPAETGANVLLVEPIDEFVYARAMERDGLNCAAPSQVAADLLTGPGRNPAEAEALLEWMAENESVWRS